MSLLISLKEFHEKTDRETGSMTTNDQHLESANPPTSEQINLALSRQGPLGALLYNSDWNNDETNAIRQMRESLRNQFDQIINEYASLDRMYSTHPAAKLFISALSARDHEIADDVLLFVLATTANWDPKADHIFNTALVSYIARRSDYDSIFRHLVPSRLRERADEETSPSSLRRKAVATNGWKTLSDLIGNYQDDPVSRYVPTGLSKLDQALQGWDGLTVIGGDRGTGKTTLMLWAARAAVYHDPEMVVLLFSLDMSRSMLQRRLTCMEANVDFRVLNAQCRTPEVVKGFDAAHTKLCREIYPRLCIVERSDVDNAVGMTVENILGLLKLRQSQVGGAKRVMLMCDLFQKIVTPDFVSPNDADSYRLDLLQQVRIATRSPSQPDGAPIIVASEIRKVDRYELSHNDLLGTSRLSSDADAILLMWSKRKVDGTECLVEPLNVRIDKGRDGVQRIDVPLWFAHTRCQFSDEPPPSTTRGSSHSQNRQRPAGSSIDPMAGK